MFLTWTFWKALQHPPRQQAIYRYARKLSITGTGFPLILRVILALLAVVIIVVGLLNPSLLFGLILGAIALIPVLLLVFNSTIQGVYWLVDTYKQISPLHRKTQVDLLYLTPYSSLGIVWLIAINHINKSKSFQRINLVIKTVFLVVLGIISMGFLLGIGNYLLQTNASQQLLSFEIIRSVIYISLFIVGMWLDYMQSIITSVLLAILAPTYTKDTVLLSSILPIGFLASQFSTYLVTVVVFIVFRIILMGLFGASILTVIGISMITLLSFYFMREMIISVLWQVIQKRYDARLDIELGTIQ